MHTWLTTWLRPSYRLPALFSVCVVLISLWWAIDDEQRALNREQEEAIRHLESLSQGLGVLFDMSEGDDEVFKRAFEQNVRLGAPIQFATIARGDEIIAHTGEPFTAPLALGIHEEFELIIARRSLESRRRRCNRARRRDMNPEEEPPAHPWEWLNCKNTQTAPTSKPPLDVYVGLHSGFSPEARAMLRQRMLTILLGVWICLGLFVVAWVRKIRTRALTEAFREERQRRLQLEDMNLAAAGLAHETRNPLGLILGLAQRLARDEDASEQVRDTAWHIVDEADRAAARLSDFLNFASIRKPELDHVALFPVITRVVEALRADFEGAGMELVCEIPDRHTSCDAVMLEQILINLLLNSFRASAQGSCTSVTLDVQGKLASLVVRDEGAGIPADLIDHIFKPYVTSHADGHGLGLAIVARQVMWHEWRIDVESSEHGTTFTISGITLLPPQPQRATS